MGRWPMTATSAMLTKSTSTPSAPKAQERRPAMATSTKATNSNARKEAARKAGKCQICGEKTKGHSVVIDYDKGKVIKSAAGKAKAGHAFYCSDDADKKVTRYEWKLARRSTKSTTGRGSRKQRSRKGAAKGSTTKRQAKRTKATPKKAQKAKGTKA